LKILVARSQGIEILQYNKCV